MAKVFLFSGIIAFLPALAGGGSVIVGAGAGESEFSVAFSRVNLPNLLAYCKNFDCHLTSSASLVLDKLSVLAQNVPQAVFKSEKEMPGAIFKLSLASGEVWFNQDRLWLDADQTKPYAVADAVNLWIDVLSTGQNFSPAALDHLKKAESQILGQNFQTISDDLGAVIWKQKPVEHLYLFDSSGQTLDVQSKLEASVPCTDKKKMALEIFSGTWQGLTSSASENKYVLTAQVIWSCGAEVARGEISVLAAAEILPDGELKVRPDSVQFVLGQ